MNPRAIVFATSPLEDTPYPQWCRESGIECLYLVDEKHHDQYAHVGPTLLLSSGAVYGWEHILTELAAFRATAVFARNERDVLPAAALRECLALPGQGLESAEAYRNKSVMKSLVSAAGVRVPRFFSVRPGVTPEIPAFGFPVVVKPVDGSGSVGTSVVPDLESFRRDHFAAGPTLRLVEEFVTGEVAHYDGIAVDGKVLVGFASCYINDCLSYRKGDSCGSRLLDPASDVAKSLARAGARVVDALPSCGIYPFHAEFFLPAEGEPIFCEIASRTPGGRIKHMIRCGTGLDLDELAFVGTAGIALESKIPIPAAVRPAGFLLFYAKSGKLVRLPTPPATKAIESFQGHARDGESFLGAEKSGRGIASLIFRSRSFEETEADGRAFDTWFQNACLWESD